MPEIRECIAHFLFLLWFYEYCLKNHLDLTLLGLWADAPDNNPGEKKLANGSVYRLQATSTAVRGANRAQTPLWPPMWRKTASQDDDPPALNQLKLQGVSCTNRAIIMDMGELKFQVSNTRLGVSFLFNSSNKLFLQLAYLTHTSIQIFTRSLWEGTVQSSLKKVCISFVNEVFLFKKLDKTRGYCIGIAFEFQTHFIAFVTLDQVFQVCSSIICQPSLTYLSSLS